MIMSGQMMYKTPKTRYVISLKDIVDLTKGTAGFKDDTIVNIIVPLLNEEGYVFENEEGVQRAFKLTYQDKYRYVSPEGVVYVIYPKFPRLNNGLVPTEAQIKHMYHKASITYSSTVNEVKMYNFYISTGRNRL